MPGENDQDQNGQEGDQEDLNDGAGSLGDQNDQDSGGTPETWELALAALPEEVQTLYTEHTTGLRSALTGERKERKSLAKQLRDVSAKLEENSEARTELEQMTTQLDDAEKRADFVEDAVKEGVRNPRLAWLAAKEDEEAFDRRGNVNWAHLKEQYPELFAPERSTRSNAGAGTNNDRAQPRDMNRIIRRAAGRVP